MFATIIIYFQYIYSMLAGNIIKVLFGTLLTFTVVPLTVIVVFSGIYYFYLDMVIYQRTAALEYILPDYLQVVSTNVKSGLSFEKSLWLAIKPRFGILAHEMEIALKKVMTGHDLAQALDEFALKYNSPSLRRSLNLIIGEIDSGGKISHIIDSVVENIKKTQKMKAEMAASVITYMIFIGAVVIVIAPALFALSYHLLTFIDAFIGKVAAAGAGTSTLPFSIKGGTIDTHKFQQFSILALSVVSLFSAMIVSTLERGNIRGIVKYFPIFIIGGLCCYFVFMLILKVVFGGIVI
jgi:hypothetical protein